MELVFFLKKKPIKFQQHKEPIFYFFKGCLNNGFPFRNRPLLKINTDYTLLGSLKRPI